MALRLGLEIYNSFIPKALFNWNFSGGSPAQYVKEMGPFHNKIFQKMAARRKRWALPIGEGEDSLEIHGNSRKIIAIFLNSSWLITPGCGKYDSP